MKRYQGFVSIQCKEQFERGAFYLGTLAEIQNDSVLLLGISPDGAWEEVPVRIPYKEVWKSSFGDNYGKKFYQYAKKSNV